MKSQTSSEKGVSLRVRKTDLLPFFSVRRSDQCLCVVADNNLSYLLKFYENTGRATRPNPKCGSKIESLHSQQLCANQTKLIETITTRSQLIFDTDGVVLKERIWLRLITGHRQQTNSDIRQQSITLNINNERYISIKVVGNVTKKKHNKKKMKNTGKQVAKRSFKKYISYRTLWRRIFFWKILCIFFVTFLILFGADGTRRFYDEKQQQKNTNMTNREKWLHNE